LQNDVYYESARAIQPHSDTYPYTIKRVLNVTLIPVLKVEEKVQFTFFIIETPGTLTLDTIFLKNSL
jgi:hypothetical protein